MRGSLACGARKLMSEEGKHHGHVHDNGPSTWIAITYLPGLVVTVTVAVPMEPDLVGGLEEGVNS